MQLNSNISYPVNLGTSQWGTGNAGTFIPFAQVQLAGEGLNPLVWNATDIWGDTILCTKNLNLWWVGNNQFALQNADGSLSGIFVSFWNNPNSSLLFRKHSPNVRGFLRYLYPNGFFTVA